VLKSIPGGARTPLPRHHPAADAAVRPRPAGRLPARGEGQRPAAAADAGAGRLSTEDADELALPALLDLPPAVDPLRRQAVLAGYIQRLPRERGGPATPEQAWSLAGALATLLDEIALEERDLDLLAASPPDELADAWLERLAALVPEEHAGTGRSPSSSCAASSPSGRTGSGGTGCSTSGCGACRRCASRPAPGKPRRPRTR
jgi:ATP-dependent helicase/nuclease subunit B